MKKFNNICEMPNFRRDYIARWIHEWQGVMDSAIANQKWDFVRTWLGFTLEDPAAWVRRQMAVPLRQRSINEDKRALERVLSKITNE